MAKGGFTGLCNTGKIAITANALNRGKGIADEFSINMNACEYRPRLVF
jgi:hypothetical protein